MTLQMRGAHDIKSLVLGHLEATFPARLVALRAEADLQVEDLPDPQQWLKRVPEVLDRFPIIAAAILNVGGERRVNAEGDVVTYWSSYALRVFEWVVGEKPDPTELMRDRMSGALRLHLLDQPTLGAHGDVVLVDDTFTEEFSDLVKVKGDRWVAGSFIGCTLRAEEAITRRAAGTVLQTVVHPALMDE